MKIKQPIYGVIAAILLVVISGYVIERILFLQIAEKTTGTVYDISSTNSRCGGKRRHNCTKFNASIKFNPLNNESEVRFVISAGSSRGHNRPLKEADYRVGENVPVVYDPNKPTKAYEDSFFGVWGVPIMLLFFQIISFFTSLTEPKRRIN